MESKEFIGKFAEALDIEDVSGLTLETEFRNLDEWNSIAIVNVIVLMDEVFDKQISNTEIRKCITIGDIFNLAD